MIKIWSAGRVCGQCRVRIYIRGKKPCCVHVHQRRSNTNTSQQLVLCCVFVAKVSSSSSCFICSDTDFLDLYKHIFSAACGIKEERFFLQIRPRKEKGAWLDAGELWVQTVCRQLKWLRGRCVWLGSVDVMFCSNNSHFCRHMASSSPTGFWMNDCPVNYLPDSNTNGFIITFNISTSTAWR